MALAEGLKIARLEYRSMHRAMRLGLPVHTPGTVAIGLTTAIEERADGFASAYAVLALGGRG
ncbi:hypothetical protein ACIGNX_22050 [Actinosynnema sp. NPDC053489]|uniref:hypothetical protein n=1 Tax=Actinosynnema sp. NPDC053489 TaxID=3363916 RepID=UPI0037CC36C8